MHVPKIQFHTGWTLQSWSWTSQCGFSSFILSNIQRLIGFITKHGITAIKWHFWQIFGFHWQIVAGSLIWGFNHPLEIRLSWSNEWEFAIYFLGCTFIGIISFFFFNKAIISFFESISICIVTLNFGFVYLFVECLILENKKKCFAIETLGVDIPLGNYFYVYSFLEESQWI